MKKVRTEKGIILVILLVMLQLPIKANVENRLVLDDFAFNVNQINELNKTIKQCGNGISVFYKDINSGYTYTYNSEQKYFIASVIKAPYCMYILDLASQGKCDLKKRYTYSARHQSAGTGKIQYMSIGTSFTLEELLGYAIEYSDNVAMNILKENFPVAGYKAYAKKLGLKYPEDIKNATNGSLTAIDAGIYAEAIYKFIQKNPNGDKLRKMMLSTTNPMITSRYPVVRKYGWATASFHDMAIVEAPNPYLLCILTNHDGDFTTFKKISKMIEDYSQVNRKPSLKAEAISTTTLIDGRTVQLEGYCIGGENYYKLRDVAETLNGTHKQFDISYDIEKASTVLLLGARYSGELKNNNLEYTDLLNIEEKQLSIIVNQIKHRIQAYLINHNNYVKIRDIAQLINLEMLWSNTEKQMTLIV